MLDLGRSEQVQFTRLITAVESSVVQDQGPDSCQIIPINILLNAIGREPLLKGKPQYDLSPRTNELRTAVFFY
jgi:hypothetical protein